jgi:LysM repeat protein
VSNLTLKYCFKEDFVNRFRFLLWLMVPGIVVLLVTGCITPRPEASASGDIDQFVPPPVEAAAAEVDAGIRVQPPNQQLKLGDTTAVEIWIDNVTDLVGVDIQLQFNPEVLQVQDIDSGQEGVQIQPGNFLSPDFVIDNRAENTTGSIFYALVQVAPTSPVSGSGWLATISFRAVAEGNSQLAFTSAQLVTMVDGKLEQVSVVSQPGQITVGQPTGEPTATFTPTLTSEPDQPTSTPTSTSAPGADTPTPTSPPVQPTATPLSPSPTPLPSPTPSPVPSVPTDTPVPPVTNIPPGATVGFCYRVKEGDTLYSLGQQFDVHPHHINVVNALSPPGQIFVHQALFIPEQMGYGPNVYVVSDGETLAAIADRCHLSVAFLASVNDLAEGAALQPNHVLIIPIPPFPPPSRFPYPPSVSPPVP